jgi:hypothetical protein
MSLFRNEAPNLGFGTTLQELSGYAGNPVGAPVVNNYKPITRVCVEKAFTGSDTTGWLFRAPWQCQIIQVSLIAEVAATATAALQLYTVPVASQPEAPSSGLAVFTAAQAISSASFTANTVFVQTLTTVATHLLLNPGDLLGYNFSAAITAVVGGLMAIEFVQLG